MSFAQGAPTQPLVLQGSNVFLYGSSTSGNAFTVQQQSAGNVASFVTSTGATALFINPTGNVGIGTNPSYILDVLGGSTRLQLLANAAGNPGVGSYALQLSQYNSGGTEVSGEATGILFSRCAQNGSQPGGKILFISDGAGFGRGDFAFSVKTSGVNGDAGFTEVIRIKESNQCVGIGTTNPNAKLSVAGDIYMGIDPGSYQKFLFNCGNNLGRIQGVYNGGSTNPDGLVNSDVYIGVNYDQQTGVRDGAALGIAQVQLVSGNGTDGKINFRTSPNGSGTLTSIPTRMTVTSSGVGIGTSNPGYLLDVQDSVTSGRTAYINFNGNITEQVSAYTTTYTGSTSSYVVGAIGSGFYVGTAGYLIINYSPTAPPFSFAFWVKPVSPGASQTLFSINANTGLGTGTGCNIDWSGTGTTYVMYLALPGQWTISALSIGSCPAGVWTHICVTVTSGYVVTTYNNGSQVATATGSGNGLSGKSGYTYLGVNGDYSGGARYANSSFDEFCYYNRALAQNEITMLATSRSINTNKNIYTDGNIGIGNTQPQARIWVPATSTSTGIAVYNADVALIIGNTAGVSNSNTGSIQVKAGGSSTGIGTGNYHLTLNPDGGNVGIGVPTGTAFIANLQVLGNANSGPSGYGHLLVDYANSGSAGGAITIRNSAGGTSAFASLIFELDGSTSCTSSTTPIGFAQGNGMLYCQNVGPSNAGKMGIIQWNGSAEVETLTILPTGNVGIGTASPAFRHHVYNGDASVTYYGPNATWSAYLMVGAGGNYSASQRAQVMCSNGNLHIDCGQGAYQIYLNYYQGGGNGGTNATVGCYAAFTATGDITAFSSDERLKTKVGLIENALDKVCSLTAFKYTHNDIARQNGFTDDNVYVGLSAQEVQKVLPEVVKPAPFDQGTDYDVGKGKSKSGENYLTIQYERIVSLLVEALKEEKAERLKVDERLARLEKLLLKE